MRSPSGSRNNMAFPNSLSRTPEYICSIYNKWTNNKVQWTKKTKKNGHTVIIQWMHIFVLSTSTSEGVYLTHKSIRPNNMIIIILYYIIIYFIITDL